MEFKRQHWCVDDLRHHFIRLVADGNAITSRSLLHTLLLPDLLFRLALLLSRVLLLELQQSLARILRQTVDAAICFGCVSEGGLDVHVRLDPLVGLRGVRRHGHVHSL